MVPENKFNNTQRNSRDQEHLEEELNNLPEWIRILKKQLVKKTKINS